MNDDERKRRAEFLTDWAMKNRMLMELPDDFLLFVATAEANPTDENLARLEKWIADSCDYLQKRVENSRQSQNPTFRPELYVQGHQFQN